MAVAVCLAAASWTVQARGGAGQRRAAGTPARRAVADPGRLGRIDELVETAITDKQLPGAVVLIGRGDEIV